VPTGDEAPNRQRLTADQDSLPALRLAKKAPITSSLDRKVKDQEEIFDLSPFVPLHALFGYLVYLVERHRHHGEVLSS